MFSEGVKGEMVPEWSTERRIEGDYLDISGKSQLQTRDLVFVCYS